MNALRRGTNDVAGRLLLIAGLVVAWRVYRPDKSRPMPHLDFGEFVPVLRDATGWFEQFLRLEQYVQQHGRSYPVSSFATVVRWQLFETWMPGWQMFNAVLMTGIVVLCFQLLRRLGASTVGAAIGSSVFLFGPVAAQGWMRLTQGEVLATLVLLALANLATEFQRSDRWRMHVAWFVLGSVFIVLAKEMIVPAIILPLLLALTFGADGKFEWRGWSRRNVMLVAGVAVSVLATLTPLVAIYLRAPAGSFAGEYGRAVSPLGVTVRRWLFALLPFEAVGSVLTAIWVASILGFVGILVLGWALAGKRRVSGTRSLLALGLFFPLLGVLSYSPWPLYEPRYALPYLVGAALAVGLCATAIANETQRGSLLIGLLWSPLLVLGASESFATSSRSEAVARTFDAIVSRVTGRPHIDSVFVASDNRWVPDWTGLGPTLVRYAVATNRPWPPMRAIRCAEISEQATTRSIIVVFGNHCQPPTAAEHVSSNFVAVDWNSINLAHGSVFADLLINDR